MTDFQIKGPVSFWFDAHYNTRSFIVLRPGISYRFDEGPALTAGYAHLWTNPGNGTLTRNEHRPWGQVFFPARFSDRWSMSQRVRLDLRFRQNTENGEPAQGYTFTPRWRSQTALTQWFPTAKPTKFFVQTALEVLANGGKNAGPNFLDQNRVSLLAGVKRGALTVRAGYMDRFVPGTAGTAPLHEHNALIWVNYRYRRAEAVPPRSAEEGNP